METGVAGNSPPPPGIWSPRGLGLNTRIFSEQCRWERGGEIPKGGRAGRARSLEIWHGGGEIPGTPGLMMMIRTLCDHQMRGNSQYILLLSIIKLQILLLLLSIIKFRRPLSLSMEF